MTKTNPCISTITPCPPSGQTIPTADKYALTIRESSAYFNIGVKKMRKLAEENLGRFAVQSGNRFLIIRPKFEHFLDQSSAV